MEEANDRQDVEISFVIPARNEELLLAGTIDSIKSAASFCKVSYEIIVSNDASDDATADIARNCGAQLVDVEFHNIGAVRNAGAEIANGRVIFFLDADTQLPGKTLKAVLNAIKDGAVGGGAAVEFDENITWFQRQLSRMFLTYWQRFSGWAAGCSIYVLRDVFEQVGGFDTTQFAAEERYLSEAIRKQGKFVLVREPVITSARKLRIYSTWHLLKVAGHAMFIKKWNLKDRSGLEILYDAPRETQAVETKEK